MELIGAAIVSIVIIGVAGVAWFAIRSAIRTLFEPANDAGEPLIMLGVRAVAKMVADEVRTSISGALMGHASAISKQVTGLEQDAAGDQIQAANPLLAALMQFSPSLRRRVTKSPYAAMALSALPLDQILAGIAGKVGGLGKMPGNGRNAAPTQSSFELGK